MLEQLRSIRLPGYPFPKYRYGSAGGLYPVQTYLYLKPDAVENMEAGTYYYHPERHGLVAIRSDARIDREAFDLNNRETAERAGFYVLLVGAMNAIQPLYGELAADFCKMEAGIVSQMLETTAPECGIGLCQVGNFNFDRVLPLFEIEKNGDLYLHCLAGGGIEQTQISVEGLIRDAGDLIEKVANLGEVEPEDLTAPASERGIVERLRSFAASKLPAYMVPSTFVLLDAIPLTENGKVDRGALSCLSAPIDENETVIEPRTKTERHLATLWSEVLSSQIRSVGTDFFSAGGDSLSAVRLLTRIRAEYQIEVPIRRLFELTTVERQAAFIDSETAKNHEPEYASMEGEL
jgi:SagB-type dehydrogenase family enzyme